MPKWFLITQTLLVLSIAAMAVAQFIPYITIICSDIVHTGQ